MFVGRLSTNWSNRSRNDRNCARSPSTAPRFRRTGSRTRPRKLTSSRRLPELASRSDVLGPALGSVDDLASELAQLHVLVLRLLLQDVERLIFGTPRVRHDHSLGLFDRGS